MSNNIMQVDKGITIDILDRRMQVYFSNLFGFQIHTNKVTISIPMYNDNREAILRAQKAYHGQ